ncbi:MAG: rod shape-determining protein RodA [Candidatus Sungbacteria bacterium]|uniref:Probable peptidoglycan glycosyltransferase FtsW n=1 Tax=Candidatus Sungiibacteriota bacterium TaxID=2750080 RepID=A0A9D6QVB9_9BACT|nr:rod shape-determining protein RodA [Candidatus Sungbacteria bacterium]
MDWILAGSVFVLLLLSLVSLASFSTTTPFPYFSRQIIWILLGIAAFFTVSFFDYRILKNYGGLLLLIYLLLLVLLLVLIVVGREVRGVVSWFRFGSFALEPGEFMKIALVLILAKYFSRRHVEIYRLRHLIISGLYAGMPAFLVLRQPDLGMAVILGSIWLGIVLFSGIKFKHLAIFFLLLAALSVFGWYFMLAPYQHARIISFLNPWNDPLHSGYNAIQAMIAVGSGKIWGKGLGYGSQTHLNFLPEPATDFIFAGFAEEWGLIGVLFLLLIYFVFFLRLFRIGMRAGDNFARLVILGVTTVFFVHVMINIGMNMGLFPITGITLPFVSYGGSSILTDMILVGLVQSISVRSLKSTAFTTRESLVAA